MVKKTSIFALGCAVLAASTAGFAQEAAQAPPQPPSIAGMPAPSAISVLRQISISAYPMLEARLKLTDEQKPKVRDLLTKAEESIRPKLEAQRAAGKAFALAVVNGESEATMLSLGQAAAKADGEVLAEKIKTLAALRGLLDSQQKKELSDMLRRLAMPWLGTTSPPLLIEK